MVTSAGRAPPSVGTPGGANGGVKEVAARSDPHALGREPDEVYGLVSVLYHALEGTVAYDRYVGDAQRAGDAELERFFRACRNEEQARARRAKALLTARLAGFEQESGTAFDEEPEELVPIQPGNAEGPLSDRSADRDDG
jgi:hypothetical protein